MGRKGIDLTGQRFGRLVAIEPSEERVNGSIVWLCECDCGNTKKVSNNSLLSGYSKSCGCLRNEATAKGIKESDLRVGGTNISSLTKKISKNNTSGHKGVYLYKKSKKWRAEIMFKGKSHYLGSFENIQDAIEARKQAEEELFEPMLEKYAQK